MLAGEIAGWDRPALLAMLATALAVSTSPPAAAAEEPTGLLETRVTLVEPGEEPRRPLRYEVEPGAAERVEIRLDLRSWNPGAPSKDAYPRAVITAELEIDAVDDGEIHVSGTYLSVDTEEPALEGIAVEPAVVQQILGPVVGARFRARLTDRGVMLESDFEPEEPLEPLAAYMIEMIGLDRPLNYMVAVLPLEEVGAAAVWQVRERPESLGVVGELTVRNKLAAWDDDVFTIEGQLTLLSEDEEMQYPGAPPDTRSHVVEGRTAGERESELRIDRLTPVEGRLALRTESHLLIERPTEDEEIRQVGESVMRFRAID